MVFHLGLLAPRSAQNDFPVCLHQLIAVSDPPKGVDAGVCWHADVAACVDELVHRMNRRLHQHCVGQQLPRNLHFAGAISIVHGACDFSVTQTTFPG
jgi:hypothetical protein